MGLGTSANLTTGVEPVNAGAEGGLGSRRDRPFDTRASSRAAIGASPTRSSPRSRSISSSSRTASASPETCVRCASSRWGCSARTGRSSSSDRSANTLRNASARSADSAAPVGFCARLVTTSARTPRASARATSSTSGPSSSTRTGSVESPSAASRSSMLAQPGSSTATRSPGRRCAVSARSMPSSAPLVTAR